MLTSGRKLAFDQRGAAQSGQGLQLRERALGVDRGRAASHLEVAERAAQAVASVAKQVRLHTLRRYLPVRQCQVSAFDRMNAKRLLQLAFGSERACKDQEAGGVFIKTLHGPELPGLFAIASPQQKTEPVDQGIFVTGRKRNCQQPRRLTDHHHVRVEMNDRRVVEYVLAYPGSFQVDTDAVTDLDAHRGVGRQLSIAPNLAALTELARAIPRAGFPLSLSNDICERPARMRRVD